MIKIRDDGKMWKTVNADGTQSFLVPLKGGSSVDVTTEAGANELLSRYPGNLLSFLVKQIFSRFKKKSLNGNINVSIYNLSTTIRCLANADKRIFGENVSKAAAQEWLNLVITLIKAFAADRSWIATGDFSTIFGLVVLEQCANMLKHAVPAALAFESDFFQALTNLVVVRKGSGRALPSEMISKYIVRVFEVSYMAARLEFEKPWDGEKTFKKLEATGILEQFLRCITVPHEASKGLNYMLDDLQESPRILSSKFKRGNPCGDVLHAILEGKDGSSTAPTGIRNRLQNIATMAKLTTPKGAKRSQSCQNCGSGDKSEAFQQSLMHCARCKETWYCSKACQKADWKNHKVGCVPNDNKALKAFDVVGNVIRNFMATKENYPYLMTKMAREIEESGMKLRDMVLELDFMADDDGNVPALQDPPCYTIVPKQVYFEGGRLNFEFFETHEDHERIVSIMKEQHLTKMESCAFIIRYGPVFCLSLQGDTMYSDKAIHDLRKIAEKMPDTMKTLFEQHYMTIMVKLILACERTGLPKNEMVVEVDLMPDDNGIIPAMQDPPVFKVAPVRDYIEGDRPALPACWWKHNAEVESNQDACNRMIQFLVENFEKTQARMEPEAILTVLRYSDTIVIEDFNFDFFSNENIEAFHKLIVEKDFDPLSRLIPTDQIPFLLSGLTEGMLT